MAQLQILRSPNIGIEEGPNGSGKLLSELGCRIGSGVENHCTDIGTVSSRKAYIADLKGEEPSIAASALGWEVSGSGDYLYWAHSGPLVGWIQYNELYLEAETAMACVKQLAREQGNELIFTDRPYRNPCRKRAS